jgi:AcrR family transcriptional regulator
VNVNPASGPPGTSPGGPGGPAGGSARAGRKRSEQSRQAILAATIALVGEVGYAGLTIEGIAARSGAGKQTIYRWWPGKADVLLDALAEKADLHVPVSDEGSFAADLRTFLGGTFRLGRDPRVTDVLRALMAHAQLDTDFRDRFRASFLYRRRDALATVLHRAQARGELPASLSPGTAADIVFGVVWYRILATGEPLDEPLIEELIGALTRPA